MPPSSIVSLREIDKPEPGAFDRAIGLPQLVERIEDGFDVRRSDADAGVFDIEPQLEAAAGDARRADAEADAAVVGELHRVAEQVEQDLPELAAVDQYESRQARRRLVREHQSRLRRAHACDVGDFAQQRVEIDLAEIQLQPARLDLREVEDFADERQQVLAAALDPGDALALIRRQRRVTPQQLRVAEDAVERRAQLVTHVRQEFRLRAIGRLRGILREPQRRLRLAADERAGDDLREQPQQAQILIGPGALDADRMEAENAGRAVVAHHRHGDARDYFVRTEQVVELVESGRQLLGTRSIQHALREEVVEHLGYVFAVHHRHAIRQIVAGGARPVVAQRRLRGISA